MKQIHLPVHYIEDNIVIDGINGLNEMKQVKSIKGYI